MCPALAVSKEAHAKELAVPKKSKIMVCIPRLLAIAVVALWLLSLIACEKPPEKPKVGPPEVLVADVIQQSVPDVHEWVAQLNGPVNADITPKVQGYLLQQNYSNGYFVKKGQLLFELDPRQYEAALDQAKAEVAIAEANLARVQAD